MNLTYENNISYEDYKALRAAVGWRQVSERQYEIGLKSTHYLSVVKDNDRAVGMIKGLGDGGYYWFLSDLVVHPDYQGHGIGKKLVEDFLKYVDNEMRSCENYVIHLASSKGKEAFYEKFGFSTRPFGNMYGSGMSMFKEKL